MSKTDNKPKKHIPQRTCVACREVNEKRSLIRLVRTPDGVVIDTTGRLPGRGAYLHDSKECWEKALKRGVLARSLKTEISQENLEILQAYMDKLQ
ncbi:MAG: YlxR family protein [Flexilinea sp.]|nr:YlxR family protein [Flexilinea sp.]